MDTKQAYDLWAETYDKKTNVTRDLEAQVIRETLTGFQCDTLLELGCGTGKNTGHLSTCARQVIAVDYSKEMLRNARNKIDTPNVQFIQEDITAKWSFLNNKVDAVVFSLILEHIEDLAPVFEQSAEHLRQDGVLYLCELHPYRQYRGVRAHFERKGKTIELDYYVHHISDYMRAARMSGLHCHRLEEWFDEDDPGGEPRLVSFIFQKQ